MRNAKSLLLAIAATASLATVAACGGEGGTEGAVSKKSSGSFGECETYGEQGSVSLDPVSKGALTVQTTLPSPGWWKGETPETTTGGYEFCLAANIAHRAGLEDVTVDNVGFDALVAGQTKGYDIAMAQISVTPEREKVVQFSAPYFDSNIGVLAPKDTKITQDTIRDAKLGVEVGTTAVAWAQGTLQPSVKPQLFQDTSSMVTAVAAGITDAAVQDTAIMLGFAKNSGGALEVVGQFETGEKYAAIYPQESSNSDAISGAIEEMREDGTLDKLSATWLGPELGGDPAAVPVWTLK